ncbi:sugar porter family MFS transporter [Prevotella sp. A2931]|uniref:Sugar porter family MFS transporter n=1 Tax=Prevotella illustrans TaxID=2800387 RepID=A0ABS3M2B7_9BACT|nr:MULTISPECIES: sugar porter family MFS transporter [Prevotella]MBO1362340.1 sugar porter family MFS transporter [Prevotella illustrans]PTL27327.1 MFS transporter [Prevotella sp. oral taxon 820]
MEQVKLGYVFFLAFVAAIGGLLFGYDTAVISGTIDQVTAQFGLDVIRQGWYVGCALTGSIVGVAFAGVMSDKLGRRPTMFVSAMLFTVSAAGCAVSPDFGWLVVYRIIGGLGIGIVSVVAPVYISEIAVTRYRGRMVSLYQLAVTVGFLAAYFVNYLLLDLSRAASFSTGWLQLVFVTEVWRGMLGMETLPALLFVLTLCFIPESPRWLITRDRDRRASAILSAIYRRPEDVERQMADTRSTLSAETKSEWRSLLRPGILKAVVIGVCIAILGQFMGVNAVLYYGPSIFKDAGMDDPLFCQVLVGIVNTLTTVLALLIIDRVGRKKLIYYGVSGMIACLVLIAVYFAFGASLRLGVGFMLTFFLLYVFCCAVSISAVVFVLLSEMYPNSVRGLAMSIAGLALWVGTYLIGQLTPWMLANLTPAGTFLLFAVMCVPYMLIMWRLVPETAGMSLEDIERYWTRTSEK